MNNLQILGERYNTDKSKHFYKGKSYLDIYSKYFENIRNEVKTFVEIGVLNGASLKMWKEYFPNANIYGIDIDPRCKQYEEERIEIIIGDQNDHDFLNFLSKEKFKQIDVLLDDGSHITKHQINTFNYLYDLINPNGFYIIEDLRNSYEEILNQHDLRTIWPGMIYNKEEDELKNFRNDFNSFLEEKIKNLDFHNKETRLFSIHAYPMIVIFENKE